MKLYAAVAVQNAFNQPPSGGCVLKLARRDGYRRQPHPAAFRRLCVETDVFIIIDRRSSPAAFRRLCVETISVIKSAVKRSPAAFRRLCVETTERRANQLLVRIQPPSGGCVLKLIPMF